MISREKFIILNLWSLFDDAPQDDGIFAGSDFVYSHGDIAIREMGFTYDQGKTVFTNLNLTLSGSRKIALVGPSG